MEGDFAKQNTKNWAQKIGIKNRLSENLEQEIFGSQMVKETFSGLWQKELRKIWRAVQRHKLWNTCLSNYEFRMKDGV